MTIVFFQDVAENLLIFGWSRVSFEQTAPHQGGLAYLQEAREKRMQIFSNRHEDRGMEVISSLFSKTGTLKKSTVYYLRRFRSTNNADFPSTKYFTAGLICFEFAEGV